MPCGEELGGRQEGGGQTMLIIVSVVMGIQCTLVEARGCCVLKTWVKSRSVEGRGQMKITVCV